MPYAIDLGNTTLTVWFEYPQTQKICRIHHWVLAEFSLEQLIEQIEEWLKTEPINTPMTWVSTNPTVECQLLPHLRSTTFRPLEKLQLLTPATNGGVDFSYYQASWETMGLDRIVNALFYAHQYPAETGILINAGTATTLDIMVNGKTYGGGIILAGLGAWQQALPQNASHLPLPLPLSAAFRPPTTTQEAINHGNGYPYALGLLAYSQQLANYWGSPLKQIVVTGGYGVTLQLALEASLPLLPFGEKAPLLIVNEYWAASAIFSVI